MATVKRGAKALLGVVCAYTLVFSFVGDGKGTGTKMLSKEEYKQAIADGRKMCADMWDRQDSYIHEDCANYLLANFDRKVDPEKFEQPTSVDDRELLRLHEDALERKQKWEDLERLLNAG